MNDPKRWLDEESEAEDQERALLVLGLGAEVDPPSAAEDATWQALLRQIGPGSPGSDSPPDPPPAPPADGGPIGASALPKTALLASPLSKIVLSMSLLGATTGVLLSRAPHDPAPPAVSAAKPRPAPPRAAASVEPRVLVPESSAESPPAKLRAELPPAIPADPARRRETPAASHPSDGESIAHTGPATEPAPTASAALAEPPPAVEHAPGAPSEAPKSAEAPESASERMQKLLGESQLVSQARAELQGGNAAAALRTLARLDAEFPQGKLRQEREVLTIEALAASGQRAAAAQRAEAFLRLFPRSPYAARLQTFVPSVR